MNARPKIRVAGTGATPPVAEDLRSIPEMVLAAVEMALADAGMSFFDIDAIVTASVDLYDGLTASNVAVTEVVGAVMKPETRIAGDGLAAAIHAACQIWADAYENVLVVAHGKGSMVAHPDITSWAMDPIFLQPLGVDFQACAGLEARALSLLDADAERRWAALSAERKRQACARTKTGDVATPSADEILASPYVASPIRTGMCAAVSDQAVAMVFSKLKETVGATGAVTVRGVGHDLAAHALGDRDLTTWEGLTRAWHRACRTAGILDPRESGIDLVEPSCAYAHQEELFLRATGLTNALCSPRGGLFFANAPIACGLFRAVDAATWLKANGALGRRALAHGTWGPAGQAHAVMIFEVES